MAKKNEIYIPDDLKNTLEIINEPEDFSDYKSGTLIRESDLSGSFLPWSAHLRRDVILINNEPSLTKQAGAEETDVNFIMKRYKDTGIFPEATSQPQYGDFSEVADYHTALNTVIKAEQMFADLPSELREKFNNDPEQYVNFATDPKNQDELYKLGMAVKPEKAVIDVHVMNPTPDKGEPAKTSPEPKA